MSFDIRRLVMQHPQWKVLVIVCVALPAFVTLAVLAFAWPAGNISPRHLPLGLVGASSDTERAVTALERGGADDFDLHIYSDGDSARGAIRDRDVYGALDVSSGTVQVLTSTAASPAVARLLATVGSEVAALSGQQGAGLVTDVATVDVVAADPADPQGLVLSSALLPLTICSIMIAAVIALLLEFRPAWRMIVALAAVSALSGLGTYLVVQPGLDALPHHGFAAWGALSLLVFAMSSTTAGLISMAGTAGLGAGAALMVFIGNPFSGSTTAPELLPELAHYVGQWLPPGAGANLLRSIVYFDGHGAGAHVGILLAWVVVGLATIVTGHRSFVGFAARRQFSRQRASGTAPQQSNEAVLVS